MKGIEFLRDKLEIYRKGALSKHKIYDMKNIDNDPGITIPKNLKSQYQSTLGWCSRSVDSIADRLVFRNFENDRFNMNDIFQMNSADILIDDAKLSALINSCSFIYISESDTNIPRLQVISGSDATGIIDPITRMLTEGYLVLKRDENGEPIDELYFETGLTARYVNKELTELVENIAPYPLLVPIIHKPDANKPFGRSRITKSAEYWQKNAKRTLERADVASEFYSWPQKYVLGLDENADLNEAKATITSMLNIRGSADGNNLKVGQFEQQSMSPFVDMLKNAASGFAGETGLTLDDLGFSTDNPSSAEAIKASHETLRLMAEKAQRDFSSGLLNVGYLAVCLRDNYPYKRNELYETKVRWQPVFKPDASTISLIGDAVVKINQSTDNWFTKKILDDLTGLGVDIDE